MSLIINRNSSREVIGFVRSMNKWVVSDEHNSLMFTDSVKVIGGGKPTIYFTGEKISVAYKDAVVMDRSNIDQWIAATRRTIMDVKNMDELEKAIV